MSKYKLSKLQMLWRLMVVFAIGEAVLFGLAVWIFDLSGNQLIGLVVLAIVFMIIFAARTWKNEALND